MIAASASTGPVAPGPPLTPAQRTRYRRNIDLAGFGEDGQRRLLNAQVLVVGAGGLGSPVLLYLAAAGVGQITIADGDVVEVPNLQRQVIHDSAGTGRNKAESAAARLQTLNPDVRVRVVPDMVTAANSEALIREHDLVLDCCDSFGAKFLLSDAALAAGRPIVWAAAVGMQAQTSVFGVPDATGRVCTLRTLFPQPPPDQSYPLAVDVGVLGAMVGQVGSVMATEAIKLLAGFGEPLIGRVLVIDAAAGHWDVVPFMVPARNAS